MNKKILLPVVVSVVVLLIMFVAAINGLSVPPAKSGKAVATAAPEAKQASVKISELIEAEKKKLHPQVLGTIRELEKQLAAAGDDKERARLLEEIGKKWIDIKKTVVGAHYFTQSGLLENSEKKLTFASHLLNEGLNHEENPEVRHWMAETAEQNLLKVLSTDSHNVDAKIELANTYMVGMGQPMKGVAQLQDIVRQDSSNLQANLILGRMAIESNQLDKAIERGKLVLRYHPDSWEARIFMAEANYRMGNKQEAISLLKETKKLNKNTEFHKDVDRYIEKIEQ